MELFEYLRDRGEPLVLHRIMERIPGSIEEQLNDIESSTDREAMANDIRILLLMKGKPPVFQLFKTPGAWYPAPEDDRLVDIVVLGVNEEICARVFKAELDRSADKKKLLRAWYELHLSGYLRQLQEHDWVEAILLRGDMISPRRYCTDPSDINLFLVVNFEQENEEKRLECFSILNQSPGKVHVDFSWLDFEEAAIKRITESGEILPEFGKPEESGDSEDVQVVYTVFCLPTMMKYREKDLYQARLYHLESVKQAEFVFSRGKAAQRFLRLIRQ